MDTIDMGLNLLRILLFLTKEMMFEKTLGAMSGKLNIYTRRTRL